MPCTTLDPKTALVVIDLQKGIVALAGEDVVKPVLANAARLAGAFRRAKQTVVLVNVAFSADGQDRPRGRSDVPLFAMPPMTDFHELLPELGRDASDLRVTKRQQNAFYGTDLDLQLRRRGVTNIVLCGIATSAGVEGTARSAYERAYNITFASDAMADRDPAMHEIVTTKTFPRIGEVDTTDAILRHLK
jgi:nicotinamidase-related amidase